MYNLFLDDEREVPNDGKSWVVVRSYQSFVSTIESVGLPSYISFDNDLGTKKEGYDCAKWLVDYCLDNNIKPDFDYFVHSQNPIAKQNICGLLENFVRL